MIDIPNYEIGKLAGRGGVAEVYLARHKLLDRKVAIKLISPVHAGDLADKRFLKEAKVVAGLRHTNIVSIYDVGVYENKYYIIMEYLEGGDLKQNIKRTLPVAQALKILRQIASALAHAHDKGFIHRDIKSQNIMFRGDGTAVLTDFGIVKDLASDTGYTMDGTSIGTPHYMSPEQAQGSDGIDWRTDLYSLGVTFYEMLTGSVPYNADSPIAVALKHIKDPVPQLSEQYARFQPTIYRKIKKNFNNLYQLSHDLISAIDRLDRHDSLDSFDSEDAAPTYPFLMPQKFGRKVN
ncbi:MAG: serine/threonine-protein kinase, partial [Desulfobacteraceae bacterium]|nr:serine/threonine-protein kinase [Desulfobacteraceae bacterium]